MRDLELLIENIHWKDAKDGTLAAVGGLLTGDAQENSSVRGMNVYGYENFADKAKDLVFSFIETVRGVNYDNIIIMGHSRGAALATRVANALYDEYPDNFLRLVLQDPVSKNVGNEGDRAVIQEGRDIVKKLADAGKEVHIISKTELQSGNGADTSIRNYETYAPELIGTQYFYKDSKISTSFGSVVPKPENRITDSVGNEPDMRNVYFHLAHMQHGYMLQGKNGYDNKDDAGNYTAFHKGFGAYKQIISTEPWTTTYSDGIPIDIDKLAESSETLQRYIKGERSATEDGNYNPDTRTFWQRVGSVSNKPTPSYEPNNLPDDDPLNKYYRTVWVNRGNQGQDRQHALVHSLAYKTLIPAIKIDVSATEVNEGDATEIVITAESNRTFDNDQIIGFNIDNIPGIPTATLNEDYTLSGVQKVNPLVQKVVSGNYTITIPAGKDTATATLKIVDDSEEEGPERIKFSIDPKDGVINKTSNLGEIKGIIKESSQNLASGKRSPTPQSAA